MREPTRSTLDAISLRLKTYLEGPLPEFPEKYDEIRSYLIRLEEFRLLGLEIMEEFGVP